MTYTAKKRKETEKRFSLLSILVSKNIYTFFKINLLKKKNSDFQKIYLQLNYLKSPLCRMTCNNKTCFQIIHTEQLLNIIHPYRWVCFLIRTDLEKFRITSLAYQLILCSEWVPSELEVKLAAKGTATVVSVGLSWLTIIRFELLEAVHDWFHKCCIILTESFTFNSIQLSCPRSWIPHWQTQRLNYYMTRDNKDTFQQVSSQDPIKYWSF